MAKSLFWPTYVAVSAAVLYGTWAMTPVISEKFLSPSSRETIRDLVAACVRHPLPAPAPQATTSATPVQERRPSATAPTSSRTKQAAPARTVAPAPAAQPVRAKAPAAPQAQAPEEDDLPALLGVQFCQPGKAPWGVLNQVTTATKRDGTKVSVPGGRFFIIKSRRQDGRDYTLVGSFSPDKLGEPVALSSENLFCFTGSPDKLTQNQRNCLRNYYELRGKALARKNEILRANAAKSPYGRPAADALAKFKALAEKVKKNGEATSSDANRKATYELTQLKNKVQELGAKHKAWKQAHASELADPEQDLAYRNFMKDAQKYAAPIAGMTY